MQKGGAFPIGESRETYHRRAGKMPNGEPKLVAVTIHRCLPHNVVRDFRKAAKRRSLGRWTGGPV